MRVSHGLCLLVSVIGTACSEPGGKIDTDPGTDREVTVEAELDAARPTLMIATYGDGSGRMCRLTVARVGEGDGRVTSDPRGISCGRDCSEVFACGRRVQLTAVPSNSTFGGWSGACSGTGPCTVTLVEATTRVDAAFTVCGNGVLEPGEECDDGNQRDGDGCDSTCRLPRCGNGVLGPGEQCDDGNQIGGDGCSAQCQLEVCGNGILDPGEQCDDGNAINGDGCSAQCQLEVCGNGILDPGEQCDAAGESAVCDRDCTFAVCGDALVNLAAGEQCDDGPFNGSPGARCSATCTLQ